MPQTKFSQSHLFSLMLTATLPCCGSALAQAGDPTSMNLETLLNSTISSASKYEQDQQSVPAAVSVITREDIRDFGWRTLMEALRSLPGIHSTYDRQYEYLGVRGLGLPGDFNTRVLLAINGNRVNDVVYDGAQVGREFPLDMALVERIEYIMGPGGAVYGQNAMIAVVNVITRTGFQLDGAEVQAVGVTPIAQQELAWRWGRRLANGTDMLFSLSAMESDGEDLLMEFPGLGAGSTALRGIAAGLDGESDREFFAQIKKNGFGLDVSYGRRMKDDPTGSYYSDPFTAGQSSRDSYLVSQLSYEQSYFDGGLDLLGRLFSGRQRYTGYSQYMGDLYVSNGISDWQGGELRLLYRVLPGHTLMFGLEGQENSRADQRTYDEAPGGNDIDLPASGHRVGAYVQDEWHLHQQWTATLGARIDNNSTTGSNLSPRAALVWQATPATSVKTLFGRAWRAPNAYEALYDDGSSLVSNPALKGERNDTFEVIVEHSLSQQLRLRASAFHWHNRNIIQLGQHPASAIPQYHNTGKVEADGAELALVGAWASGTRLWSSVTWQDLRDAADMSVINSPPWLAKLAWSRALPWADLRLSVELQYEGERRSLAGNDLGGATLLHASISGDAGIEGLEWNLGIRDLLDRPYSLPAAETNWQDSLEQQGRQLRLQIHWRL